MFYGKINKDIEKIKRSRKLSDNDKVVTMFGSARTMADAEDYDNATQIARILSDMGYDIITGGGPGIMEAGNLGAFHGANKSIGLGINLPFEQSMNEYLDIEEEFDYFFTRKAGYIYDMSGFIVMPGGFGTLDELFEVLTLIQTEMIREVPVILVNSDFWGGLVEWSSKIMGNKYKTISKVDMDFCNVVDTPCQAVYAFLERLDEIKNK